MARKVGGVEFKFHIIPFIGLKFKKVEISFDSLKCEWKVG